MNCVTISFGPAAFHLGGESTLAQPSSASDDIYALASSFFHVVFEKEPFSYDGGLDKERGLNWEGINRAEYPILAAFLDKATHQDPQSRFASVTEALSSLEVEDSTDRSTQIEKVEPDQADAAAEANQPQQFKPEVQLSEQRVDWLLNLLQVYPGSRWAIVKLVGLTRISLRKLTWKPTWQGVYLMQSLNETSG